MGAEISVEKAGRILRKKSGQVGKPGSRIHLETAEATIIRLKALEGPCGQCENILLEEIPCLDGSKGVSLRCRAGRRPLDLYKDRLYADAKQLQIPPSCPARRQTIKETA